MLNRRHIRIKVMQTLYPYNGYENIEFLKLKEFLFKSIDNMYILYLLIMALFIEVQQRAEVDIHKKQKKQLATLEDKNPNRKFVNNEVLHLLKHNSALLQNFKTFKINQWELDNEYVEIVFKSILKSPKYENYMKSRVSTFKEDALFIGDVFKDIIAPNEKLYEYFEDKNLTWLDDLPTVNTTILKLFTNIKPEPDLEYFTPKLYKDDEDKQYALTLLTKTIENLDEINKEISEKTINWDADRIANIDYVLLRMALCEIKHFPSIPVKVTINEYLEIAKEYSTPKSSIFINGILDKIVKEYQEKNSLNKSGRGLI